MRGCCTSRPAPESSGREVQHLLLEASAADADSLAAVEDVLGRHLERFGARRELTVTWRRADDA